MSQGAYRRVCGASTPKGVAQRGCSATGPAFSNLFSFRRSFRYHARMVERTLAIIKPDAVSRHLVGTIIQRYEQGGLIPVAMKMVRLTKPQAEAFYYVHKQRPFFDSLCSFMSSGPIVVLVLEGENAIRRHRDLMGATDPAKAAKGTIRKTYGTHIEHNAVHGSDSAETAKFELSFFFSALESPQR